MHIYLGAGPGDLFVSFFFLPHEHEKNTDLKKKKPNKKNQKNKQTKEWQIQDKETIFKCLSRLAVNASVPYSYNTRDKNENKAPL